ncbi:hypothetical protein D9757_005781 [Collybiopsis confluens]|uniref:F-box domain-containing protein n=1 Tax=Collybiopsis confluens TaxID=2823264 RepID=A0A8H5MB05_9AGAR|nr:hypothetical protein D9757_005781 [Collybiopsis confluens]
MSVTTIANATQAQLDHIDQEILNHEEAVRELKSRRNLLAPISKLPAEILCTIFMFCNAPDHANMYAPAEITRWRWIIVTHISRLWRASAMNCPILWSKPEFTKTDWAYEMIRRSKKAPLTIEVNSNYWLTPRVVDAVSEGLKHLDRINEIHLTASRDNMEKLLSSINLPAPFLRSLHLDIGRSDYYYHSRAEPYMLPENFLAGDTQKLRHIELIRCYLRWDSPLLSNLSHLQVHNPGAPAPALDQFLVALSAMPRLETLDLEHALPLSADTASTEKPRVNLARLRKLRIVSSLTECAIFLDRVSFPSSATAHIVVRCADPPENGSESLDLVTTVCQRLPVVQESSNSRTPVIKSLRVQSLGPGFGVIVEAWSNPQMLKNKSSAVIPNSDMPITLNSFVNPLSGAWLKLEISWQTTMTRQLHNEVVAAVCTPLPLSQLKTLHVWTAYHDCFNSLTFARTFGVLPKVNQLTVQGDSAHELVEALNPSRTMFTTDPSSSSAAGSNRPNHSFPALRTLKLLETDFDRSHDDENTLLEPLIDCLILRYESRSEIQKLVLERCSHLNSVDVTELEDIVVDLEWDEVETGYSDSEDDDMDDDFGDPTDYMEESYFGYGDAYMSTDEDMMFF